MSKPNFEIESESELIRIEARPKTNHWWGIFAMTVMGLSSLSLRFADSLTQAQLRPLFVFFLLFWTIPALIYAWWIMRAFIIADENGVRWRGLGRERNATWAQVSEIYLRHGVSRVQTANGKFQISRDWANSHALRAVITARAMHAKTRQWVPRGATLAPGESKTFKPAVVQAGCVFVVFVVVAVFVLCIIVPVAMSTKNTAGVVTLSDHVLQWSGLLLVTVTFGSLCVMIGTMTFPFVLHVRARRGESITVTPDGICWRRGAETIRARWDEVRAFRILPVPGWLEIDGRREVETLQGTFSFELLAFKNGGSLQSLIEQHLPDKSQIQLEPVCQGHLQTLTDGSQLFTYRSFLARIVLTFLFFLIAFFPLHSFAIRKGWLPAAHDGSNDVGTPIVFEMMLLSVVLYGTVCYLCSSLRVDKNGIEHRTLWRTRRIEWAELRAFYYSGGFYIGFETSQGTLVLSNLLNDINTLMTTIVRYAPHVEFDGIEKPSPNPIADLNETS